MEITETLRADLKAHQRDEFTGYHIYRRLAATIKSEHNRDVLERIATDEMRHYSELKRTHLRTSCPPG